MAETDGHYRMPLTIGEGGRITVPKQVRENLDVSVGDDVDCTFEKPIVGADNE